MEVIERRRRTRAANRSKRAASNQMKLRDLFRRLQASSDRCTCHDFVEWQWLWRKNPCLVERVRGLGHHLWKCALATELRTPHRKCMPGRRTQLEHSQKGIATQHVDAACDFCGQHCAWRHGCVYGVDSSEPGPHHDLQQGWKHNCDEIMRHHPPKLPDPCFEAAGVAAQCVHCGACIELGVLRSGHVRLTPSFYSQDSMYVR